MKILIVDDSPIARKMVLSAIPDYVKAKATIYQAKDGAEGIELYKEHLPDIVYLDLTMPVMDGFDTLENLKIIDPNCIVVIVTADVQAFSQDRAKNLGAKLVLTKPVSKDRIESTLRPFFKDER